MPFIATSATETLAEAVNSFEMSIPPGHQADDILIAFVTQDGGGTAITVTAGGWTQIGTQAAAQAQRTALFWKRATSSNEPDFTATGAADEWVVCIAAVRGANVTTPIHQFNRTDSVNSTTAWLDSGTVTTTQDHTLLLYCWGFDNIHELVPQNPNDIMMVSRASDLVGCVQIVGYRNQISAGQTPVVRALSEVASEGGSCWVIAVADSSPSWPSTAPFALDTYTVLCRYGGITTAGATAPAFIRHDGVTFENISAVSATSIGGFPVGSAAFSQVDYTDPNTPWGGMTGINVPVGVNSPDGVWVGVSHSIPPTDMTGRLFALQFQMSAIFASYFGSQGCIVYFQDSAGSWAAFQLSPRSGMIAGVSYVAVIDLENGPKFDQGEPLGPDPINWQDIVRIGYAYHRRGTATTAAILRIKNALLIGRAQLVDGSYAAPVTPALLDLALNGWGPVQLAGVQGRGEVLGKTSFQFGNGVRRTYVDAGATAYELPFAYDRRLSRRFWQVAEGSCEVRIVASPTDTVFMQSSLYATDTRQIFRLDLDSSWLAAYDFEGASIVGFEVQLNTPMINLQGVTFKDCHQIELFGSTLSECRIVGSKAPVAAVRTNYLPSIYRTHFESRGSGHAIELTYSPGNQSYALEGCTFEGYGANETTDAAIYNNSGTHVTINIPVGDQEPTVRNGVGASTTIQVAPTTLSIVGVVPGSDVVVLAAGTTTVLAEADANPTTTFNYQYTYTPGTSVDVAVYKAGYVPLVVRGYLLGSTDALLPVNQVVDRNYVP